MTFGWQDALVAAAALGAGAWLVRYRRRRRKAGCDSCPVAPGARARAERVTPVSSLPPRRTPQQNART